MKRAIFQFKPFSVKQKRILTWWLPNSPVKNMEGIIADGAIRSGKTLAMSLSFVMWAMASFNNQNFGMCGKTIGSFRRNVLFLLKAMLYSRGYRFTDRRADNLLIVRLGGKENYFHIFGGKDERSQDLIQGITLAGVFFDEVALMPESFVNQATGRCSVDGSKFWFNCNPEGPQHWFRLNWILKWREKGLLYLHFTMDDNLSLSLKIKERYRAMYEGVFFKRFILGWWVAAEGVIYKLFAGDPDRFKAAPGKNIIHVNIGIDFGGTKSQTAFVAVGFTHGYTQAHVLMEECRDAAVETPEQLDAAFVAFCRKVKKAYPMAYKSYGDSAEQYLVRGLDTAIKRAGLGIEVKNAWKTEINDRIRLVCALMGTGRFFIAPECTELQKALQSAIWDEKKQKKTQEDARLDDGSYNMDVIDAMEYAIEPVAKFLRKAVLANGFEGVSEN